jgi:hypothetical protein
MAEKYGTRLTWDSVFKRGICKPSKYGLTVTKNEGIEPKMKSENSATTHEVIYIYPIESAEMGVDCQNCGGSDFFPSPR